MYKRFLMVTLALCVPAVVFGQQNIRDFVLRTNMIDGIRGLTITSYVGKETSVVIPSKIDGLPVTSISDQAFMLRGLTHVIIPESVLIIGKQAFFGNRLLQVSIPSSVRVIGEAAFDNNDKSLVLSNKTRNRIIQPASSPRVDNAVTAISPAAETRGRITIIDRPASAHTARIERPVPASVPEIYQVFPSQSGVINDMPGGSLSYTQSLQSSTSSSGNRVVLELGIAPQYSTTQGVYIEHDEALQQSQITPLRTSPSTTEFSVYEHSTIREQVPPIYRPGERTVPSDRTVFVRDLGPLTKANIINVQEVMPPDDNRERYYIHDNEDGTATLVGYWHRNSRMASIPPEIEGLKPTMIWHSAFLQQKLTHVLFPATIIYIGDAAFSGNSIRELVLPASVKYIGFQAFAGNDIMKISLGSNVNIQPDSVRGQFATYYNANRQQKGTYLWNNGTWTYTNLDEVEYYYGN